MMLERYPKIPTQKGLWLKFATHYDRVGEYDDDITSEEIEKMCTEMGIIYDGTLKTSAFRDDFYHEDEPVLVINVV